MFQDMRHSFAHTLSDMTQNLKREIRQYIIDFFVEFLQANVVNGFL